MSGYDPIDAVIRTACRANEEGRCRWRDPAECGIGCREPVIVRVALRAALAETPETIAYIQQMTHRGSNTIKDVLRALRTQLEIAC